MPPLIDLAGRTFGRLAVIERAGSSDYGQPRWRCRCECGTERVVFANSLRTGATTSCGCKHRETITTHGATGTPEFTVWQMMKQRCLNHRHTSYRLYGGRGITICVAWRTSFARFLSDMGPRPSSMHTLERVDNADNYRPGNCEWATPTQQGANKRNNRRLTFGDTTHTLAEWCRLRGIPKSTVLNRLHRGVSVSDALTRSSGSKLRNPL